MRRFYYVTIFVGSARWGPDQWSVEMNRYCGENQDAELVSVFQVDMSIAATFKHMRP
jgi:hypothetical protein